MGRIEFSRAKIHWSELASIDFLSERSLSCQQEAEVRGKDSLLQRQVIELDSARGFAQQLARTNIISLSLFTLV